MRQKTNKRIALLLAFLFAISCCIHGDFTTNETVYASSSTAPTATTLSSVTQRNYNIIIKWKKQTTRVTGYQIQYALNSKFTKSKKTITIRSNATTSYTLEKPGTEQTYYIRVRTYYKKNGKTYLSKWSTAKSLYMKPYSARWKKLLAKYKNDDKVNQLVFVGYVGGSDCIVMYYEKKNGKWELSFKVKGYVGKSGINKKKEGDMKTPTGTFNLTTPFGIKSNPGSALKYLKVNNNHYWSSEEDTYNQLVDVSKLGVKSIDGEHLIDFKPSYNYSMFVDYNKEGVYKKGCCIFLHCFAAHAKYTWGCVAIPEENMKYVIQTADSAKICIYNRYE